MSFMKSSLVKFLAVSAVAQLAVISSSFAISAGTGTAILEKNDKWSGVVQLSFGSKDEICTGTVIHPNLILTAAHCIFDKNPSSFSQVGVKFGNKGSSTQVKAVYKQLPTWSKRFIREGDPDKLLVHDLMIIVTSQSLTSINPSLRLVNFPENLSEANTLLSSGEELAMGYGLGTNPKNASDLSSLGTKRSRPVNAAYNTKHKAFVTVGGGQCKGDSGGGLYAERNGELYTVGVLSGVDGKRCVKDIPAGYVDISQHLCWIQKASGIDLKLNKQCSN